MNRVSIRLKTKLNCMSAVYLVFGASVILPDGTRRKSESLKMEVYTEPKTHKERQYNEKILEVAEYVRCNRQIELIRGIYRLGNTDRMENSFFDYIDENIAKCQSDKYNGIKQCLKDCFGKSLRFKDISVNVCEEFRTYLSGLVNMGRYSSNTATSYFNKFLNLIALAHNENLLPFDYSKKVPKMKWVEPLKESLTDQEVTKLLSTPFPNKVFKRGVEFSLRTGLRHSDIVDLKWSHIQEQGDGNVIVTKVIVKTVKNLIIPLNQAAINLLGKKGEGYVFKGFPDNNGANKMLKEWLVKAKISKKITYHSARHSISSFSLKTNDLQNLNLRQVTI